MRKRPIGQILVEKNEISEAELAAALAEQERTGLRLGQILIETGRISWLALARAIAEQVLDIEDVQPEPTAPPAALRFLPRLLLCPLPLRRYWHGQLCRHRPTHLRRLLR
jgi:hypothetical protein